MKILVISGLPWNKDNSFGSTYSSFFEGMDNVEFANIYCGYGYPKNNIKGSYFQITEKSLLKNLLNSKLVTGKEVDINSEEHNSTEEETRLIKNIKKTKFPLLFFIREIIWCIGRWKSDELNNFINTFNPDIIFSPLYYNTYLNNISCYAKQLTGRKMVTFVSDDIYSLKQFSLSPLFWFDRMVKRVNIKKMVGQCEYLYVISDMQKNEYEKYFNKECRILTKGAEFLGRTPLKEEVNGSLKLVYTGGIYGGRWKSLAMIGKSLTKLNRDGIKAQLFIYSMTPVTGKMMKALNIEGSVFFMGGVSSDRILKIQSDADILVHVESTELKERLLVRHSFSTKLIDYFHSGRCIFAVGTPDVASIDYLFKNDAALVATDEDEIENQLNRIVDNPQILKDFVIKAWQCGKRNHEISQIQKRLHEDLKYLVKDR